MLKGAEIIPLTLRAVELHRSGIQIVIGGYGWMGKIMNNIKIRYIAVMTLFAAMNVSCAGILYEWDFSKQADGTALKDVASVDQPYTYFPDTPLVSSLVVSNGNLIINRSGSGDAYVDIADLSSGTYWLVLEVSRWANVTPGGTVNFRFNSSGTSSGTLAAVWINEQVAGHTYLQLTHSGGTANVATLDPNGIDLKVALRLDLDNQTTTVLYKLGDGNWVSWVDRTPLAGDISHIRFQVGAFANDNQVEIKRIVVSDVFPVPVRPKISLITITSP